MRACSFALAASIFTSGLVVAAAIPPRALTGPPALPAEEVRAVAFLSQEVPRWKVANDCYSCHNNGDAARALLVAASRGHAVGAALDDTLEWLREPSRWQMNKTQGGIDDKPLARVQFAGALQLATRFGRATDAALRAAAGLIAGDQMRDGSWQLDTSQSIGSPATYGTTIATAVARRTLAASGRDDLKPAIAAADAWLRKAKVDSVLDAAAVVLGLERAADADARAQRQRALATLTRGQAPAGGWGPYITVAPEHFDTALVLLALNELTRQPSLAAPALTPAQLASAITRGREFLVARQAPDGSWPETTRPANQESYAQRISTTGWVLLALMETAPATASAETNH
jgi:hypothetical protein